MDEPSFDTVEEFRDWLVSPEGLGIVGEMPTQGSIRFIEGATILTVYSRGRYRAEILCGRPGYRYTSAPSDNVERYVVFMGGGIKASGASWDGSITEEEAMQLLNDHSDNPYETPNPSRGIPLVIPKGTATTFSFDEHGGAFLLVSKFLEEAATSCVEGMDIKPL